MQRQPSSKRRNAAIAAVLASCGAVFSSLASLSVIALRNHVTDFERGLVFGICIGTAMLCLGLAAAILVIVTTRSTQSVNPV